MTDNPVMPPVNADAEQSVLGALLGFYKPELVQTVRATKLTWADFYWREHQVIYRAVLSLHDRGDHVDTVTVKHLMDKHQASTDRTATVLDVCVASTRPSSLREHALIVHEDACLRRVLTATYGIEDAAHARNWPAIRSGVERMRAELPEDAPALRVVKGQGKAA